jgi:hypothetical protein
MWRLLSELICFYQTRDEAQVELKPIHRIDYKFVKEEMIKFGYYNDDFINSNEFKSEIASSRECLIAISWFISSYKIIDKIYEKHYSPFENEFPLDLKSIVNEKELENLGKEIRLNFEKSQINNSLEMRLNYLKWLDGNFRGKISSYYASSIESVNLINKVYNFIFHSSFFLFGL